MAHISSARELWHLHKRRGLARLMLELMRPTFNSPTTVHSAPPGSSAFAFTFIHERAHRIEYICACPFTSRREHSFVPYAREENVLHTIIAQPHSRILPSTSHRTRRQVLEHELSQPSQSSPSPSPSSKLRVRSTYVKASSLPPSLPPLPASSRGRNRLGEVTSTL